MHAEDTTLILLASGRSERFGATDKLTADLYGKPLALHAATRLVALPWRSAKATIADDGLRGPLERLGYTVVVSEGPEAGMGDNLARAAAGIEEGTVLVALADMPFVTADHIEALLRAATSPQTIVVSRAGPMRAPPVLFGAVHLPALQRLTGDEGARRILTARAVDVIDVETAAQILFDIDTPQDIEAARRLKIPL
ncbi:nucleotidyltransferase family protein [Asticcacaulis sp. BYS171W]|uniref:Nucleotidyltransferase family protein n=1 Tax=Asticcacaulis aquaticus TaxID=2984212 RepID=A0ABT5HXX2_9CAUL|nr:nucleotidyltransferase family protein [Asticcacaulis aquaticus]MDC7684873.1 nucleotidyltransferase family protein [Asticcacaulis aquaticus]